MIKDAVYRTAILKCCVCHGETVVRPHLDGDIDRYLFDAINYYQFICMSCFDAIKGSIPSDDITKFVQRTILEGHITTDRLISYHYFMLLYEDLKYRPLVEHRMAQEVADRLEGAKHQ